MKPSDFMKLMEKAKMYDLTQPLSIHTPPGRVTCRSSSSILSA